jgi:hypothetical protein
MLKSNRHRHTCHTTSAPTRAYWGCDGRTSNHRWCGTGRLSFVIAKDILWTLQFWHDNSVVSVHG